VSAGQVNLAVIAGRVTHQSGQPLRRGSWPRGVSLGRRALPDFGVSYPNFGVSYPNFGVSYEERMTATEPWA
jgi:hypothetical protein